MAKKVSDKNFNNYTKKDTNGLFNGGFKSEKFLTKTEKEERRRKRTTEILSELEDETWTWEDESP